MKKILLFLTVLFAAVLIARGQTTVTGKLLGHDGKPMIKAHVHVVKPGQTKASVSVEVAKDGKYKISANETGPLILQYTGVHHSQQDVLLVADKPTELKIDVSLATYKYSDDFSGLKIMGDFNNFSFATAREMEKQPDGTFTAEFETRSDRFRYQLYGIAGTRSINGTQSEDFEYDGGGDYQSVVSPKDGKVRIVFDPKKLVRSDATASVRFSDSTSIAAQATAVYRDLQTRRQDFQNAMVTHRKAGKDMKEFKFDWSADTTKVKSQLAQEKDPLLRELLFFSYLEMWASGAFGQNMDRAMITQAFKEIKPESALWSLFPTALHIAAGLAQMVGSMGKSPGDTTGNEYGTYLETFLEKNPDKNLRADYLLTQLWEAKRRNDQEKVVRYYDLLMTKFGDTPAAKRAMERRLSPEIKIAVGKTVPNFSLVSLDDSTKTLTNQSFKGKVYLIDFWAVWCGPCIAEMEHLHKAYEKFKSKRFEILSISLDWKPEDVVKFRKDKWKMPWHHAFLDKGIENPVAGEFEVIGIPKPILVDGDTGKILATEMELRGENLEKTLSRVLAEVR